MYAVSVPLDDKSKLPKDDSKDLMDFISDGHSDDHSVIKRHSHTAAGRVFALRAEQANDEKAKNPKTKRDTGTKTGTDPDQNPKLDDEPGARKIRDVSKEQPPKKDQHRIARDTTQDKKPKRIARYLTDSSKPIPQPPKSTSINKRDTSKEDPKKNIDKDDNENQRKTRSADEDKGKIPDHKPKRDTGKDKPNKHIDKDDEHQRKIRSTDDHNDKIPEHKSKRDTTKDDPKKHIDKDEDDHQRKSRAVTDEKNKTPKQKPKREAKDTKPDTKNKPPQKSGSSKQ